MNRSAVLAVIVAVAVPALLAPAILDAQAPRRFKNLKVFPKDTPRDSLLDAMRGYTQALGVRCEFCHATVKTASGRDSTDFPSDAKKEKNKARFMMRMVHEVNETLVKLPDRETPAVAVSCVTCHRGSPVPRTIDMVVAAAIDSSGVQTGIQRYHALRDQGMEAGRFDFSEGPINDLAHRLAARGKANEAIALLGMNAEFHPQAASVDIELGDIYRMLGRTDEALAAYKRALEKQPGSMQARRRLDELTGAGAQHR